MKLLEDKSSVVVPILSDSKQLKVVSKATYLFFIWKNTYVLKLTIIFSKKLSSTLCFCLCFFFVGAQLKKNNLESLHSKRNPGDELKIELLIIINMLRNIKNEAKAKGVSSAFRFQFSKSDDAIEWTEK